MTRFTKAVRALLITACVLLVAPAAAFADCGTSVIDDYLSDGTISGNYSQACYKSALGQIPTDADLYTDIRASITAAMRGSGSSGSGGSGGSSNVVAPGTTTTKPKPKPKTATTDAGTTDGTTTDALPVTPGTTNSGIVGQALNDIGPKHADEIPMPVIILGGLAALLILAGAGGLIAQRRSRRLLDDELPPGDSPTAETAS
jgi:hypothetical protein